jgi:hypothetical protein
MIEDSNKRIRFNRRLDGVQSVLDDLVANYAAGLLPIEQVGRLYGIATEMRAFRETIKSNHD